MQYFMITNIEWPVCYCFVCIPYIDYHLVCLKYIEKHLKIHDFLFISNKMLIGF